MASSSSSSFLTSITTPQPQGRYEYDVFLSFRGEDTRDNFVSHLYAALSRKQIRTFKDDKELRRGEEISPSLLNAIEKSNISVIIFSENYASSKWCLEELTKILQCKKMNGLMVIPVFYRVDPSTVRKQTGSFAAAFAKHEELLKDKVDKVQNWRTVLEEAANLSGWDSSVTRPETKLISEIVNDILEKLDRMSQITLPKSLVGIESRIKKVESLLSIESEKVYSVGIWGMGGIGKTTLARAVFFRIHTQFEGAIFLENVKEELKRDSIVPLWNKLLSSLLGEKDLNMRTLSLRFTFTEKRLRRKKIVIVFDDVDDSNLEQLIDLLVERHDLFGGGSKILITSRDKQVLKNLMVDEVCKVDGLSHNEALQLFCINAFKGKDPTFTQMDQTNKVVNYANGNPLAIRVLGSTLFGRGEKDWNSALDRLEKVPKPRIMNVLRISYDGLSDEERNLFLDIACFFKGENRDCATKILESYHFCVHLNIDNLINKSLITISHSNELQVHDLLQEMGRRIIYDQCPTNPGERSRLWDPKDIYDVLTKKKGTKFVESICLDLSESREMHLQSDAFEGINCLKLLKFYRSNGYTSSVHLPRDGFLYLSNELRYFHWEAFPSKSLPINFCAENLVQIILLASKVKQLWSGVQDLVNLKGIHLQWSKYLTKIPNLSKAKNIECIDLRGCESLVKLPSSIRYLDKLEYLSVGGCENLRSVPRRIDSKFLKVLNLRNCRHLKKCPRISSENVEQLYLEATANKELPKSIHKFKTLRRLSLCGSNITKFPDLSSSRNLAYLIIIKTAIEEVPPSIEFLTRLEDLNMSNNKKLSRLPNSFCKLKSLSRLVLYDCPKLESFPEIFEPMESLRQLTLTGTAIEEVSPSIEFLTGLISMNMSNNKKLLRLPNSICKLKSLNELNLNDCPKLESFPEIFEPMESLKNLYLHNCPNLEIPSDLFEWTPSLSSLDLSGNNLERLPPSFVLVDKLKFLDLNNCKRLLSLPQLPVSLISLVANDCESLETISIVHLPPYRLELVNCLRLDEETWSKMKSFLHSPSPPFNCLLPGSEIPERFSQSIGSSLTIHLPRNCHWVTGVTFCIVFALRKPPRSSMLKFRCRFKANNGEQYDGEFPQDGDGHGLLKSDHVLLYEVCSFSYFPSDHGFLNFIANNKKASFEIDFGLTKHISVKKCGVHLQYVEDYCGNFDEEDYDEDSSGDSDGEDTDPDEEDNWELMRDDNNLKRRLDDYYSNDPEVSGSNGSGRSDDNPNKRIKLLQD